MYYQGAFITRGAFYCVLKTFGMIFCYYILASAAENSFNLDSEIARLRKEISRTQNERKQIQLSLTKDLQESTAYRSRTDVRFIQMRKQMDSISLETNVLAKKRDSLDALIRITQSERTQIELGQDRIRTMLLNECAKVAIQVQTFPPLIAHHLSSSLELLMADISTKSVDNNESMTRLLQILDRMEDATASIQISQENSPVSDIRGMVYRVRFGTVFEGVVDVKGEKAAVWNGYNSDRAPIWNMRESSAANALLKAAEIREGKALPGFIMIPFMIDSTSVKGAIQ